MTSTTTWSASLVNILVIKFSIINIGTFNIVWLILKLIPLFANDIPLMGESKEEVEKSWKVEENIL